MDKSTYLYRCTEQQLEEHLQRIAEEGDAVEHVIFKGGRDYVLVCRRAGQDPVAAALEAILGEIRSWSIAQVSDPVTGVTVNGHPVKVSRAVNR